MKTFAMPPRSQRKKKFNAAATTYEDREAKRLISFMMKACERILPEANKEMY